MNPFSQANDKSVGDFGESKLIQRIRDWLGDASPKSPAGIGDDCAVYATAPDSQSLITTDPILYGVHFDASVKPEQAAAKLVRRNVSDIAAMGGQPTVAVLALSLPSTTSAKWLEGFFSGIRAEAHRFSIKLIGGDIAASSEPQLAITLTLVGVISNEAKLLERHKASESDLIYVSGSLGGSILGKHWNSRPRLAEGQWLSLREETTSCLDISDGLGKDARQLASEGLVAEIDATSIPISHDAAILSEETGKPSLYHAFNDGEDYELLFTIRKSSGETFENAWKQHLATPLTCIGAIRKAQQSEQETLAIINDKKGIVAKGYEHFA